MRPERPNDLNLRALVTIATLALAAGAISGCGGSAAPVQPIQGSGGVTPTPKPTATGHATATPTGVATVTPSPSPTPVSGGGVAAACVLTLPATGKTYAFVPAFSSADTGSVPDSLAEVTIANGTTIAGSRRGAIQHQHARYHSFGIRPQAHAPAGHQRSGFAVVNGTAVSPIITYTPPPAECAADATHDQLYLESNGTDYTSSNLISVVSVNPSTAAFSFVTNFTTDATTGFEYSGTGSSAWLISGIAYDPNQSGVILATGVGYETYAATSPYGKINQISGAPSENFGFNQATDQIFSPVYDVAPANLNLADVHSGNYYVLNASAQSSPAPGSSPIAFADPDSGSVDTITNIGVSPEEFEIGLYLIGIGSGSFSGSGSTAAFSAPVYNFGITGPLVTSIVDQGGAGLVSVAIDSPTHLAFAAGEFGPNGFCVVALPTVATASTLTPSDYACATMPTMPNGNAFASQLDPHTTSTFELGGHAYGLTFDSSYTYVAVIDMPGMIAAPRDPTDPHAVTSASALATIVSYVQI